MPCILYLRSFLKSRWLPFNKPSIFNELCHVQVPVALRPYCKVFVKYFLFSKLVFLFCTSPNSQICENEWWIWCYWKALNNAGHKRTLFMALLYHHPPTSPYSCPTLYTEHWGASGNENIAVIPVCRVFHTCKNLVPLTHKSG